MRKIVLSIVMSLGGFVVGEDGNSSCHVMDEEMHDFMDDFLNSGIRIIVWETQLE